MQIKRKCTTLGHFQLDLIYFVRGRFTTMDKIWVHHNTLDKQQFKQYKRRKKCQKSKIHRICRKDIARIFWKAEGILLIAYLEKKRTNSNKCYLTFLVSYLEVKTRERKLNFKKKNLSYTRATKLLSVVCALKTHNSLLMFLIISAQNYELTYVCSCCFFFLVDLIISQ